MFCHKCGNQLPEDSGFCHKCGAKIIRADALQESTNIIEPTAPPIAVNIAEPSQKPPVVPDIMNITSTNPNDFKLFVDNHVRTTTEFQSADDLLKNSKPWMFLWIIFGVSCLGILGGPLIIFTLLLGYAAAFIASGIIRTRYRGRFRGEVAGDINVEELIIFLSENLKYIHPYFHEWGYLTREGLIPIIQNVVASAFQEVSICSEFGPKRKRLVVFYIRPKMEEEKPIGTLYFVDAIKGGFLLDGRAAGFLGHGALIRTAPILQAAMEYYLRTIGKK